MRRAPTIESEQGEDEPGEDREDVDAALERRVHGEVEQAADREQRHRGIARASVDGVFGCP
jgi:hypothetical protein